MTWKCDSANEGITILWKQISVHGISNTPCKCIYFMLDHKFNYEGVGAHANGHNGAGDAGINENEANNPVANNIPGDNAEEDDEGNETDNDEEDQFTECWLIPENVSCVEPIFQSMADCQAMNPDSGDSFSEESDYMNEDGDLGENEQMDDDGPNDPVRGGMQNLHLDEQFEDADE